MQQFFVKFYFDELGEDGAVGEFVGEDRGDLRDGERLPFDELLELLRGNDFVHCHGRFAFDAREVVEVAPDVVATAFVEIKAFFSSDNQIVEMPCRDFHFRQFHGTLHHGLVVEGEAMCLQGAVQTVGVLGCTLQGAEFHHRLVVKPGLIAVEELVGESGEECLPFININRRVDVV